MGAADHVADPVEALGIRSPGVFSGYMGGIVSADGQPITSTFQMDKIFRPLWSVSRVCDPGCTVAVDAGRVTIYQVDTGAEARAYKS